MKWTSVNESKPTDDDYVLVYGDDGYELAYYMGKKRVMREGWWRQEQDSVQEVKWVTHWMPLPDQPKAKA